ncbi:MAG: DNA mismatch repair protein MutS, partial [Desulfobulbus sp.]|nr:DNA mismatch repair protein MutS [Desulfobulbus sp.]
MSASVKMTPMLRQYLEIKEQHPGTILFYRMGDFYEMFFEDALVAARILGITLTSRSHKDEADRVPMCGVPFHAVSGYLGKMVKAGYRVALCEQVEDPKAAKGIVRREVVRVVSPGVTTDDQLLDEKADCYVCSLAIQAGSGRDRLAGLAFLDVSTGRFQITEVPFAADNPTPLFDEISRHRPSELLLAQADADNRTDLVGQIQATLDGLCLTPRPDFHFEPTAARTTLTEHFRITNLAGFG